MMYSFVEPECDHRSQILPLVLEVLRTTSAPVRAASRAVGLYLHQRERTTVDMVPLLDAEQRVTSSNGGNIVHIVSPRAVHRQLVDIRDYVFGMRVPALSGDKELDLALVRLTTDVFLGCELDHVPILAVDVADPVESRSLLNLHGAYLPAVAALARYRSFFYKHARLASIRLNGNQYEI